MTDERLSDERLSELERLSAACDSTEEWARDRRGLSWIPERPGREAVVLYNDNDHCAEVHDNMGLGFVADAYAALFAESVVAIPELTREVRRLRTELDRIRDLTGAVKCQTDEECIGCGCRSLTARECVEQLRAGEREQCAALVMQFWKFDGNQQHLSTWHCRNDLVAAIRSADQPRPAGA